MKYNKYASAEYHVRTTGKHLNNIDSRKEVSKHAGSMTKRIGHWYGFFNLKDGSICVNKITGIYETEYKMKIDRELAVKLYKELLEQGYEWKDA